MQGNGRSTTMGISQGPGPTHQGSGPSRRFLLAGMGTAAASAALTACSVPAPPRRTTATADPMPGKAISIARHDRLMQILAHPDDDMYFMNPDAQRMMDSGTPLVCVYVTAGEATGINVVAGQPHPFPTSPPTRRRAIRACARRTRSSWASPRSRGGRRASSPCAAGTAPRSTRWCGAPAGSS